MHAIGMVLIWTAIQVTVIFTLLAILLRIAGKSDPLWRGKILLAGIVSALLASVCSLSPWPCWPDYWPDDKPQTAGAETSASAPLAESSPLAASQSSEETPAFPSANNAEETKSAWAAGWAAFLDRIKNPRTIPPANQPSAEPANPDFTAAAWIALAMLSAWAWGCCG